MDRGCVAIEEIIELNGENASYYFSQAMNGTIRIKGKFIRDENGRLRPVLVKTSHRSAVACQPAAGETNSWGSVLPQLTALTEPSPYLEAKIKKNSWINNLCNRFRKILSG